MLMFFSNVKQHLLGSPKNLEFEIVVSNFGEDSFETTFQMTFPKRIHYNKTIVKSDMSGILCSPSNETLLSCDIGNPLPGGKIVSYTDNFLQTINF